MSATSGCLPEPRIERLDPVRRIDQASDLRREAEERGELAPRVLPHLDHRRIQAPPLGGELREPGLGGGDRWGGIDVAELRGDLRRVAQRVAHQMHHTCLNRREWPDCADRVGESFEPVAADDAHVGDAPVAQLREHFHPLLCTLPTRRAHPQPEHVAAPIQIDTDRDVDGPVRDLPVTDLHHQRVDEHHRIHGIQWAGLPILHVDGDLVGHRRHQIP